LVAENFDPAIIPAISGMRFFKMEQCPSLPLDTRICSKTNRFFVFNFCYNNLLFAKCNKITFFYTSFHSTQIAGTITLVDIDPAIQN